MTREDEIRTAGKMICDDCPVAAGASVDCVPGCLAVLGTFWQSAVRAEGELARVRRDRQQLTEENAALRERWSAQEDGDDDCIGPLT